jgi:predicted ATPase
MWLSFARISVGWGEARADEYASGLALIQRGLTDLEATGTSVDKPLNLLLLCEAHIAGGATLEALATLDEALVLTARHKELWLEPELHRIRGLLLLETGRVVDAEASISTALELARRREARSWELRAATSLARLWAEQGEWQKAVDLLAPIYGWFTEGFGTPDLKEAKALLEQL